VSRALQLQHVAIGGIGAVLRVRQSSVVRQAASEPSGEISSRKAKPNLASCFEGGDKRRARARHRTHVVVVPYMWWTYVISKGMFEPHVSWPRACGGLSFRLSVSRPVTQTHSIRSSPGGAHDSDTHTSDGHQRPHHASDRL
jgi:hypothetical protein